MKIRISFSVIYSAPDALDVHNNVFLFYMLHSISVHLQYSAFIVWLRFFKTRNQSIQMCLHLQHSSSNWNGWRIFSIQHELLFIILCGTFRLADDGRQATSDNYSKYWMREKFSTAGTNAGEPVQSVKWGRLEKKCLNIHLRALVVGARHRDKTNCRFMEDMNM